MKEISISLDYLPAKMLESAIVHEMQFMEIISQCPVGEDGMACITGVDSLGKLLDHRLQSIMMSIAALDAYMSYYGYAYSSEIESSPLGSNALAEQIGMPRMVGELEHASRKFIQRHEAILAEHGAGSLVKFLRSPIDLKDKLFYFPLAKSLKLPNSSDPTVKAIMQLMDLRNEAINPDYSWPPDKVRDSDSPPSEMLTYRKDSESRHYFERKYVVENYDQHGFLWEILHCSPPQTVQDYIRYIHSLDETQPHFMAYMFAKKCVGENGKSTGLYEIKLIEDQ